MLLKDKKLFVKIILFFSSFCFPMSSNTLVFDFSVFFNSITWISKSVISNNMAFFLSFTSEIEKKSLYNQDFTQSLKILRYILIKSKYVLEFSNFTTKPTFELVLTQQFWVGRICSKCDEHIRPCMWRGMVKGASPIPSLLCASLEVHVSWFVYTTC